MKHRIMPHILAAPIAFGFWWFLFCLYEAGPIERYSRSVFPTDVRGGEVITITSTVIRSKQCSSMVYREFIDSVGRVATYEPFEGPALKAGVEQFKSQVTVPEGMTPGSLTYRVRVEFVCNPVQKLFGGPSFVLPDVHLNYIATGTP
jgi:hypothetical protein